MLALASAYMIPLQVEWVTPATEDGVDYVIVYAETDDHLANTYQSAKAVSLALHSSTEVR